MAKNKDPLKDMDLDTELKGLQGLDNEDSDFDFDADFPDIDSDDRSPVDSQPTIGDKLKAGATLVGAGAAAGIAAKVKDAFPNTADLASQAINVASDFSRMKYEFTKDLEPTINQLKTVSRRVSARLANTGMIPKSIDDKIQKWFTPEEQYKDASKEETRNLAVDQSLSNVFKAQDLRRKYDRLEDKTDAFMDRKLKMAEYRDVTNLLGGIHTQTLHISSFLTGTYTGYLKKALELKYKHYFVAQDTMEILRLHAQATEAKLDAIRHNTGLPDIQKERTMETFAALGREKLMGKAQEYISDFGKNLYKNIKDEIFDPTKEFASMAGDLLESIDTAMDMQQDEDEMTGKKPKGFAGHMGGLIAKHLLGRGIGAGAYQKLHDKFASAHEGDIERFAGTARDRALWELNAIKRGHREGVVGEDSPLKSLIDLLVPEMDTTLGKTDNKFVDKTFEAASFDNAARTSIVEIIPGYLSKILKGVTELSTGKPAEEMVFDSYNRDFVAASKYQEAMTNRLYGDKTTRTQAMSGTLSTLKTSYLGKASSDKESSVKAITFDRLNDQIAKFVFNMSQQKEFATSWPLELAKIAKNNGDLSKANSVVKDYFRGIRDVKEVAMVLSSSLIDSEGNIDNSELLKFYEKIQFYANNFQDQHKDKIQKVVEGFGTSRYLKNTFSSDQYGRTIVDADKARNLFTDLDQKELEKGDTTAYAVEAYKREQEEKNKTNGLIKALLDPKERKKLKMAWSQLNSEVKKRIRPFLRRLGIPHKWLDRVFGMDPSDLTSDDMQKLELLDKEGINLQAFFKAQQEEQTAKFQRKGDSYKEKRSAKNSYVEQYLKDHPDASKEEAEDVYAKTTSVERTEDYGDGAEQSILDKASTKVKRFIQKNKTVQKAISGTKTVLESNQVKRIVKQKDDLLDQFQKSAFGKQVNKIYKDLKIELDNETKKWMLAHPETTDKIRSILNDRKLSKKEMLAKIEELKDTTLKTSHEIKDYSAGVMDRIEKQQAQSGSWLNAATSVAKEEGTLLGNQVKSIVKKSTDASFSTSFEDMDKMQIASPVGKLSSEIKNTVVQKWSSLNRILSKKAKKFLDENPKIKEQIDNYIATAEPNVKLVKSKIDELVKNYELSGNKKDEVIYAELDNFFEKAKEDAAYMGHTDTGKQILKTKDKAINAAKDTIGRTKQFFYPSEEKELVTKKEDTIGPIPSIYKKTPTPGVISETTPNVVPLENKDKKGIFASVQDAVTNLIKGEEGSLDITPIVNLRDSLVNKFRKKKIPESDATLGLSPDTSNKESLEKFIELVRKQPGFEKMFTTTPLSEAVLPSSRIDKKEDTTPKDKFDLIHEQLEVLRNIEMNTAESAYNGILAAAVSTGDLSILDKVIKRPGIARRAKRAIRGGITDFKDMVKDSIIVAQSKTEKIRRGVKAVGKKAFGLATSPFTGAYKATKAGLVNFMDVYKDDGTILIREKQFHNENYEDGYGLIHEDGKPVKSVYEINGPIYERSNKNREDWEEVISQKDVDTGLYNSKGKKIKTIGARLGRLGRKSITGTLALGKWAVGKVAGGAVSTIGNIALGGMRATGGALNVTKALIKPFIDVFRADMPLKGDPLVTGNDIRLYGYFIDKNGKPTKVKSCYDIDREVFDIRDNSRFITLEDISKGLVDPKGNPLHSTGTVIGRGMSKALGLIGDTIGLGMGLAGNTISTMWSVTKSVAKYLFKAKDPYKDVYLKDEVHPDKVKVYGKDIENRKIFFAESGKVVKSCYDIDEPVINEKKTILISKEDIEHGLVDVDGNEISKWNKHSLGGKLVRALPSMVIGTGKLIGKGIGLATKGLGKLIEGGGKFAEWGSRLLGDLGQTMTNIFGSKKDHIFKKDLKTLVSDKLDAIYNLLDERLGKRVRGDTDADGNVEGSYADQIQDKERKKDRKARDADLAADTEAVKESKKKRNLGGMLGGLLGSDKGKDKEGGGGGDSWTDDILGGVIGQAGSKYLGPILSKIPGAGKIASLGARALGAIGLGGGATAAAGTVASTAATAAATAAGASTAATTIGATAATTAATGAGLMGTLGSAGAGLAGFIASNPVGWAIGGALLVGGGGYLLYRYMKKSDEEFAVFKKRLDLYGTTEEYDDEIEDLEDRTVDAISGKKGELTAAEMESFAKDFGCFDKSDVKGSVGFFISWYRNRFMPIFQTYCRGLSNVGLDLKNADDVNEEQANTIISILEKQGKMLIANSLMLKPSLAAYQSTQEGKKKDETAKKDGKTELETEEEKKRTEAERAAKGDVDKDSEAAKKKAEIEKTHQDKLQAIRDGKSYAAAGITTTPEKNITPAGDPSSQEGSIDKVAAMQMKSNVKESLGGGPSRGPMVQKDLGTGASRTITPAIPDAIRNKYGDDLVLDKMKAPVEQKELPKSAPKETGLTTDKDKQSSAPLSTDDYKFGKQTAKMEAGGDPGMVSSGEKWGDPGGTSYGKYQFASKFKIPEKFMDSPLSGKYGQALKAAGPVNSPEFKAKWKELSKDPGFEAAQDAYGKKMYLDDNVNKKAPWISSRSPMVQESIMHAYMGSSNQGNHMIKAIDAAGGEKLSDKEILQLIDKEYKANIGKTKGFWAGQNKDATFLKKYDEQQKVLMAAQDKYDSKKSTEVAGAGPAQDKSISPTATPKEIASGPSPTEKTTSSSETAPSGTPSSAPTTPSSNKSLLPDIFKSSLASKETPGGMAPGGNKMIPSGPLSTMASTTPDAMPKAPDKPGKNIGPAEPVKTDPASTGDGFSKLKVASGVDVQGLHPKLKTALGGFNAEYMEKFGKPITVTSGFRSHAKQEELYKKYGPSRAAKPNPRAPHMFMLGNTPAAIAVDINSADANKADAAGLLDKYGLSRPLWPKGKGKVQPEPWHLQLAGITADNAANIESDEKEPNKDELAAKKDVATADGAPAPSSGSESGSTESKDTTGVPPLADSSVPGTAPSSTDKANETAKSLPGVSELASSHSPSTGTTTGPSDTTTMPKAAVSQAMAPAGTPGATGSNATDNSSYSLEQLKTMVSLLTSMDSNLKNMLGWDLGTKIAGMSAQAGSNVAANPSGNSEKQIVENKQTGTEPSPPKDMANGGRPVTNKFNGINPVVPLNIRRNGRGTVNTNTA